MRLLNPRELSTKSLKPYYVLEASGDALEEAQGAPKFLYIHIFFE